MVLLVADRLELARFVNAAFRHADEGTAVLLRSFAEGSSEVLRSVRVPIDAANLEAVIDHAAHLATKAANTARPALFAPPVATFQGSRARERDLANGLVLTVEVDHAPATARRNLEYLLGPATLVVASGGAWTDPETGAVEPKLHLHWRCAEPTRTAAEHAELKHARRLACRLAGADPSAISIVHPLRWPGSFHRKSQLPRLARILELRPEVELVPGEVIELLQPILPREPLGSRSTAGPAGTPLLEAADLLALAEVIANPDRDWADWNRIGLAFFAASGGSEAGLAAFERVSQRSAKHDPTTTTARWAHYRRSPPDRLGAGTLIYEARQVAPAFRLPSRSTGPGRASRSAPDPEPDGRDGGRPGRSAAAGEAPDRSDGAPDGDSGGGNGSSSHGDGSSSGGGDILEPWRAELICNSRGAPRDCVANAVLILRRDPSLAGRLRLDEMEQAVTVHAPPWRSDVTWRPWAEVDDTELANWCQIRGVILKPATCAAAVELVASHHRHHALRAWLEGLSWDGTPRLDRWLETYLGAGLADPGARAAGSVPDPQGREAPSARPEAFTGYLHAIGAKWLISAVARVFRPGCKVDHVLVLEGAQGIGKSSALRVLAGGDAWFADEVADLGSKDAAQGLRGKWILELAEMAALRRAEVERMKAFLTRTTDHYRPSFGRRSGDFPRQCVFAATTNDEAYLADASGNRRFWPVKVTAVRLEELARDCEQLWAEAVQRFKAGESWWLDRELEAVATEEQAGRRDEDPWDNVVLEWLGRQTKPAHTVGEILKGALRLDEADWTPAAQNRVARCLKAHGYERHQRRDPTQKDGQGRSRRVYVYQRCHR